MASTRTTTSRRSTGPRQRRTPALASPHALRALGERYLRIPTWRRLSRRSHRCQAASRSTTARSPASCISAGRRALKAARCQHPCGSRSQPLAQPSFSLGVPTCRPSSNGVPAIRSATPLDRRTTCGSWLSTVQAATRIAVPRSALSFRSQRRRRPQARAPSTLVGLLQTRRHSPDRRRPKAQQRSSSAVRLRARPTVHSMVHSSAARSRSTARVPQHR